MEEQPRKPLGTIPLVPRILKNNVPRQPSPSSSIFSSPLQDDVPCATSLQSEDIIPPTVLQDNTCGSLPKGASSPLQSSDISTCSEVEAYLEASQQQKARRKPRKRRRIASKLSLSQNSHRQEQSVQASGDVQVITELLHIPSSDSSSTSTGSSSTTTSSRHTNSNPGPSTSTNIPRQEALSKSQSLLTPDVAIALHQPAKHPSSSSSSSNSSNLPTNIGTNKNSDISCHRHKQPLHASDTVQALTEVLHVPSTSSTSTCSSSRHKIRNHDAHTSSNILRQEYQPPLVVARGLHQSAESNKESESTHSHHHRHTQLLRHGTMGRTVKGDHEAASDTHHMSKKACASRERRVTFQSPVAPAPQAIHGCSEPESHARPQVLSVGRQEDVTLMSTSDSDQSVYYEAVSHLTILNESCAGPSGLQNNLSHPTSQTVPSVIQRGDADTSSSSFSQRESDYTSHSLSSSGSSTCIAESVLNKTVLANKLSSGTFKRPEGEENKKEHSAGHKQIKMTEPHLRKLEDKWQLIPQPRTRRKDPATRRWSQERRLRQDHREMRPPDQSMKRSRQAMEAEVSSSTSDPQSDPEPSSEQMQGAEKPLPMKAVSRLEMESSVTSSSSSSSSSVLLTQEGMGCIQKIGEVFKHYFGGTVEDNLSLIQRNDYNLLQCLMELQASPHHPQPAQSQHPSPSPAPP